MQKVYKTTLSIFIKYALGIILIYWVYRNSAGLDLVKIKSVIFSKYIFILILLRAAAFVLTAWRWQVILKDLEIHTKFSRIFELSVLGTFLNYVIPGAVSGDVIKGWSLKDETPHRARLAVSLLVDRVSGLVSMVFLSGIGLLILALLNPQQLDHISQFIQLKTLALPATIGFTTMILVSIALFKTQRGKRWRSKLIELKPFLNMKVWLKATLITLPAHAFYVYFLFCSAQFMNYPGVDLLGFFVVLPLASVATAIPITPGGLGVGQTAYAFLLNAYYGTSSDVGATVFTLAQVLDFIWIVPGAVLFFKNYKKITALKKSS